MINDYCKLAAAKIAALSGDVKSQVFTASVSGVEMSFIYNAHKNLVIFKTLDKTHVLDNEQTYSLQVINRILDHLILGHAYEEGILGEKINARM